MLGLVKDTLHIETWPYVESCKKVMSQYIHGHEAMTQYTNVGDTLTRKLQVTSWFSKRADTVFASFGPFFTIFRIFVQGKSPRCKHLALQRGDHFVLGRTQRPTPNHEVKLSQWRAASSVGLSLQRALRQENGNNCMVTSIDSSAVLQALPWPLHLISLCLLLLLPPNFRSLRSIVN